MKTYSRNDCWLFDPVGGCFRGVEGGCGTNVSEDHAGSVFRAQVSSLGMHSGYVAGDRSGPQEGKVGRYDPII